MIRNSPAVLDRLENVNGVVGYIDDLWSILFLLNLLNEDHYLNLGEDQFLQFAKRHGCE
jgi:hypothetical protein